MSKIEITPVLCRRDNYAYILNEKENNVTAVIDPSLAEPVLQELEKQNLKLDYILNTHHHYDHTDGNIELKEITNAKIVGSKSDAKRIPAIDVKVDENKNFKLGSETIKIFEVDGHTKGHIAYYLENTNAIFTGDVLFSLGCGGMFEGNEKQLWTSLKKLRDNTNDETYLYPGHEYTIHCANFAYAVDNQNKELIKRIENASILHRQQKPTIPIKMKIEKKTNPYLRLDNQEFQNKFGLKNEKPEKFFEFLRNL